MKKQKNSLQYHWMELRKVILFSVVVFFITLIICFQYGEKLFSFLTLPINDKPKFIFTSITEGFNTHLKLAIYAALLFTMPLITWRIQKFITPGLYKKEKKIFIKYIILSPLLFIVGGVVAYLQVIPLLFDFFLSFQVKDIITFTPKLSEYLGNVTDLMIAFGLAFQLPVFLKLLITLKLITKTQLKQKRKYATLIIFILAAILTPPDILSQICLAIPLLLLYEFAIFI